MSCDSLELTAMMESRHLSDIYSSDEKGHIDSIFLPEIFHLMWYSLNPRQFKAAVGLGETHYTPQTGYEYILYCYISTMTMPLAVKAEYRSTHRIGWCRNLLHEMVTSASCKIDDSLTLQWFDKHWLVMHPEYYLKPGHEKQYDERIGNVNEFQVCSTFLPRRKLKATQPWFYCSRPDNAFPLFRLTMRNSQSSFNHVYTFERSISSLLRMEELIDDKWTPIKADLDKVDGIPIDGNVPNPVLWGCMAKIRPNEVQWNMETRPKHIMYTETVVECDSINAIRFGMSDKAELKSGGPCKAVFWGAYNMTAHNLNIRSNYTASLTDPVDGQPPIVNNGLMCGKTDKFKDMDSDHFTGPLAYYHFIRSPRVNGINAFSPCYRSDLSGINLGVQFGKIQAILNSKIDDPEKERWGIFRQYISSRIDDAAAMEFKYIVRLLVMQKLTIENGIVEHVF